MATAGGSKRLSPASVSAVDLLCVSSGLGLLLTLRQYDRIPAAWVGWLQVFLGGVAVVLMSIGLKHITVAVRPAERLRRLKPARGQRVAISREGIVYLTMMGVMLVGSLIGRSNTLMLVFALMAGPFVVNGWVTYSMLKRNSVRRTCPRRAMAGQTISVCVDIQNHKRWVGTWLATVHDSVTSATEQLTARTLFTRIPPRSSRRSYYRLQLNRRGRYRLGPLRVSTRFPLGLVERSRLFDVRDELIVHPRIGRLTERWHRDLRLASEFVHQPQSRKGTFDDDFHRIREYFPGDNPKLIHWRTSARRNELMVQEYHQSRRQHLSLFLDLWVPAGPTQDDLARVEYAVSFAATVCVEHLRHGHETRLQLWVCGQGADGAPAEGISNLEAALDLLALAQPTSSSPIVETVRRAVPALPENARLVWVTTRPPSSLAVRGDVLSAVRRELNHRAAKLTVVHADPDHLAPLFLLDNP